MQETHSVKKLRKAGAMVTLASALGVLTSFLLQMVIAAAFGAGVDLDAFWVGATLPQYLRVVTVGVIGAVLIPQLAQVSARRGPEHAAKTAGAVAIWLTIILGAMSLIGAVVTPTAISLLAPSFGEYERALAENVAWIMWPTLLLLGVSTTFGAVLQWHGRYFLPAVAPAGGAIASVLLLLFLGSQDVQQIAWALVLGAAVQVALVAGAITHSRHLDLRASLKEGSVIRTLRLGLPLLAAGLLVRITPLVERFLASGLDPGTISHLSYALRVAMIGAGVMTAGLGAVILPRLSIHAARRDTEALGTILGMGFSMIWTITIPLVALGFVLASPAIGILFERGAFESGDTEAVSTAFKGYLLAFPAMVIGVVTGRLIYALQAVKLASIVGALEAVAYVGITYALVQWQGWLGIPAGFVIYYSLSLVWQSVYLTRRLKVRLAPTVLAPVWRPLLASCVAAFVVSLLPTALPDAVEVTVGTVLGLALYLSLLKMVRSPELVLLASFFPKKGGSAPTEHLFDPDRPT